MYELDYDWNPIQAIALALYRKHAIIVYVRPKVIVEINFRTKYIVCLVSIAIFYKPYGKKEFFWYLMSNYICLFYEIKLVISF